MKRTKTKLITTILASALGVAATMGGALLGSGATAFAAETTYAPSDVFTGKNAVVETTNNLTQFRFQETGSTMVYNKRNVALEWMSDATTKQYFTTKFTLMDSNFTTLALVMETSPATATKEDKAVNKLVFNNDNGAIKVTVNDQKVADSTVTVAQGQTITVSFSKTDTAYGEYAVHVNGTKVGEFTNVGAKYAKYVAGEISPLYFEATMPEDGEDCLVKFEELNLQPFALTDGVLKDTQKPVLVVDDEISTLQLGKTYSVEAEAIDVLDRLPTVSKKFHQFNPSKTEADIEYKVISTAFMETAYGDGKSVYNDYQFNGLSNVEYLAVRYYLEDEVFKGEQSDSNTTNYWSEVDLAWYASNTVKPEYLDGTASTIAYIVLDRSEVGPAYSFLTANETTQENDFDNSKQSLIDNYQTLVDEAAKDLYVGSGEYIYLPSMVGLIDDNDGYQNLKFAISYKKGSATTNSSTANLDFDKVKFSVAESGLYEFKFYATDNANNPMQYYIDGELVALNSENVWEIDEIPSFTFTVKPTAMKIKEEKDTDRKTTKVLDSSYTLGEFTVLGVTGSATSQYGLYKVDVAAFNEAMGGNYLNASNLHAITYQKLADKSVAMMDGLLPPDEEIDFFQKVYASCLLDVIGNTTVTLNDLLDEEKGLFVRIAEYDDRINETDHPEEWAKNNKYHWSASNRTFHTVEEGTYLMLASYTNPDAAAVKVAGYKVVVVEDEADVLEGEDNWLQDNLVSVILFGVAGVMLILIIILLFVKTDNKTLADVDESIAKGKKEKKSKKSKKDDKDENQAE